MRDQRGFTILEFVIYIALVGVVLGAAVMFALQFSITQTKSVVLSQVTRNAQFAMQRIEAETRAADRVDIGASVFDVHPGTLVLETSDPGTDPTVFTVTDGQLTVQQGAGLAIPLTAPDITISAFTLQNLVPHGRAQHVRVSLTASLPPGDSPAEIASEIVLESTIHIRRSDGFTPL